MSTSKAKGDRQQAKANSVEICANSVILRGKKGYKEIEK